MSELATVARPYAKALIMFARENDSLESYQEMLENFLALISEEIEKTVDFLGDLTTPLKPAVQPGRLITTIKTKALGIDDALAVMTPHKNRG